MVDYVSEEAERAGVGAVKYITDGNYRGKSVKTKAGNGIRYVIPQTINNPDEDVFLFLRVTQPFGKVKFTVSDGENILTVVKKLRAAPGEMEKIVVKAEALKNISDSVCVSLEALQ